MLIGLKSGWDGKPSHSWREQRPARSQDNRLPPVRQRRSQALAQEAFAILVATGDNRLSRALIQMMKGARLE
ncbi:hypothetical protein LJR228_000851 [Mesorhizobium caraganae]